MPDSGFDLLSVSDSFVTARNTAQALPSYPGTMPATMAEAYACQDRSIAAWGDRVAGWKIGLIAPALRPQYGAERLAGPVFAKAVWTAQPGAPVSFPVFQGGFGAVEAEFVFKLARDIVPGNVVADMADLIAALHLGIEPAGSPFPEINDHGPAVVASDFGNNAGLIIGPEIVGWRERAWDSMRVRTIVDGAVVGEGSAASVPGNPLAALAFLVEHCAKRGITLKEGDWITTGATTGIHQVQPGAVARVEMEGLPPIDAVAVPAVSR